MKKTISIILAIMMVATLSVSAFAAAGELVDQPSINKDDITVQAKYVAGDKAPEYNVDVVWGAMEFTYAKVAQVWDEVNHKWTQADEGGEWQVVGNTVKVTNDSSEKVYVTFAYDAADEGGLAGAFDVTEEQTLNVANEGTEGTSVTATLTLSEVPTTTELATVGTVTVVVASTSANA